MSQLYAVFGKPILHSKSPQLFNNAFNHKQIDAFYTRIRVESSEDIASYIRNLNIAGANITTPFKESIIDYLDDISDDVKEIGAVNVVLNKEGELYGHNTDYLGLTRSVREAEFDLKDARCLVLGAGGAARAAVYGLIEEHAKVYVANRTASKAEDMAVYFGCEVYPFDKLNSNDMQFDFVISTLLPDVELELNWQCGCKLFIDANYRKSRMTDIANQQGVRIIRGDRWLINQAIAAYQLFLESEPEIELFNLGYQMSLDYTNLKVGIIQPIDYKRWDKLDFDIIVASEYQVNMEKSLVL